MGDSLKFPSTNVRDACLKSRTLSPVARAFRKEFNMDILLRLKKYYPVTTSPIVLATVEPTPAPNGVWTALSKRTDIVIVAGSEVA